METDRHVARGSEVTKTLGGQLLNELGKGLGEDKTGKSCERCHHMGYRLYPRIDVVACRGCRETGFAHEPVNCRICKGKG